MSDLKPCPFCGSSANLDRDNSGWNKIKANHSDDCPLLGDNLLTWSSGEIVPIVKKWNTRATDDQLTTITKQRDALLKELRDIQSSCIGEITMGYKLDAESIGASISKATGMTHPEIVSALNKGNTNPSADWMSKLFSIVSRYNDFTKGWESWDDWGSYFNDGLSPQEAYAESMRTI